MYWLRLGSILLPLTWLLLFSLLWLGGWLLTSHLFSLRSRERILSGLATGILLFIVLANALAPLTGWIFASAGKAASVNILFWLAALSTAGLGLQAYLIHRRQVHPNPLPLLDREDLQAWPQLLSAAALMVLFTLINRGLALFDDYHNLPIVSMIAAGDLPPHFYLNPEFRLDYHYGLHILGASMMRVGGLTPWGAFDLSKTISLVIAIPLAWLWFRRVTHNQHAAFWGSLLVLFAGGARWLLLLFPQQTLQQLGSGLRLLGSALATGPDLFTVLYSPWKIEGGGPFPFPFAFTNGVAQPLNMALASAGALPQATLLLLLLLARRRWTPLQGILYGLLLASLALTAEHIFGFILGGVALTGLGILLKFWRDKARHFSARWNTALAQLGNWLWVLVPAVLLAVVAGGVIHGVLRDLISQPATSAAQASTTFGGFSLRWPPALTSAHFGALSITNPSQLLIALVETGALLFLAPLAIWWASRRARHGTWPPAWMAAGAVLSFIIALFIVYEVERDTSRFTGSAVYIWLILGFPLAWILFRTGKSWLQVLLGIGYATAVLGGIALFSIQLISITKPQFTYFVKIPDAQMNQQFWDRLEENTQVFDTLPYRSVTLFGRGAGRASAEIYQPYPEWLALAEVMDPLQIAQAGYAYLYLDKETWQALTPPQKQALEQPCIVRLSPDSTLTTQGAQQRGFPWLLDLHACH